MGCASSSENDAALRRPTGYQKPDVPEDETPLPPEPVTTAKAAAPSEIDASTAPSSLESSIKKDVVGITQPPVPPAQQSSVADAVANQLPKPILPTRVDSAIAKTNVPDVSMDKPKVLSEKDASSSVDKADKPEVATSQKKQKPALKKGFIRKEGHSFKSWKNRWFVLANGKLRYYVEESNVTPFGTNEKGCIDLIGMSCSSEGTTVEIKNVNDESVRCYVLDIPDRIERLSWVQAINEHIDYFSKAGQ